MDIKERLLALMSAPETFAYDHHDFEENENDVIIKNVIRLFLKATTMYQAAYYARVLIDLISTFHDKGEMGPILQELNHVESMGRYQYDQHKLHFIHSINVFLLGLFIFHQFEFVRNKIKEYIKNTTPFRDDGRLNFSGDSDYTEFLYRWRFISLAHDIGTPITIYDNEVDIKEYLTGISPFFSLKINSVEQISKFCFNNNLIKELENHPIPIDEIKIQKYIDFQKNTPLKTSSGDIRFDHGIMGGLLFFRFVWDKYKKHKGELENGVSWDKQYLEYSLKDVARTIILHNVDQYDTAFRNRDIVPEINNIYDLNTKPLVWLLKITDLLQEWDKPIAKESKPLNELDKCIYDIEVNNCGIVASNYNDPQKNKIINSSLSDKNWIRFI